MKALRAFIKPFEVPQKSVRTKIVVNFYYLYFNLISEMHGARRVKILTFLYSVLTQPELIFKL